MGEQLGRHSSDDSYWTTDVHISKPSPCDCPPGGLLKVKVCFNSTNLVVFLDQHGISRGAQQYPVNEITTPTLHFPGTTNSVECYSILHQWLHSSHLNLPLEDDVATELSNRVIHSVFERIDLHGKLAISVTAYLHRVSIEYKPYVPPPPIDSYSDSDSDSDSDDDEGLSEYWVDGLSCIYRFVAEEEHRRFGNCSICLENLISDCQEEEEDEDEDEDEDEEEEEGNKYLFRSPCGHVFHDRCMGEWLRKKDSCPLCRFTVSSQIDQLIEEQLLLLGGDL